MGNASSGGAIPSEYTLSQMLRAARNTLFPPNLAANSDFVTFKPKMWDW